MESLQAVNNEEVECNQDDLKSQDKVNLRREARRRKILENAKTRLERLNGRTGSTNVSTTTATNDLFSENCGHRQWLEPTDYDSAKFSDPEVEPDVAPQQLQRNEPPLGLGNLLSSLNTETTLTQQKRHFILRTRLHLIISALVSCILTFAFAAELTTFSFSIFIPAGLCVVTDLVFFREQKPLNPIINMVIALFNIRLPSQTTIILHLFSIIQSLIVDLGVFIFSFCIFSCSLAYINNSFTGLIAIK